MKRAIETVGFDPKQLEPKRALTVMSRAKGDALTPETFLSERASNYTDEAIAEAWGEYDKTLKKEKALDFDRYFYSPRTRSCVNTMTCVSIFKSVAVHSR